MRLFIIFAIFFISFKSFANFNNYFATIKAKDTNVRSGPNLKYPVKWVYLKKNEPFEVIGKFEQWRKIRDRSNDEGWVHSSVISSHRYVIIIGKKLQNLYEDDNKNSKIIASLEPEVRASLKSCNKDLCKISVKNVKGWIEKESLYGIYRDELIK